MGETLNGLLPVPVLLLASEWGFVISAIAFMVSVTGTGYSRMRQMCYWKCYPRLQHTKRRTHTHAHKRNVSAQWKKTQHWDSVSLPVLNVTFEPNVYRHFWQTRLEKGRLKKQLDSAWQDKSASMRFLTFDPVSSKIKDQKCLLISELFPFPRIIGYFMSHKHGEIFRMCDDIKAWDCF